MKLTFINVVNKTRLGFINIVSTGQNQNTQMMSMEQTIKNEQQMGMYDNGRLFTQTNLQNNMINTQEMLPHYQPVSYEQNTSQSDQQMHSFVGKSPRLQYVNTSKILPQSETPSYNKYNSG